MESKSKQCKICLGIKSAYWEEGNYYNDGKTKILWDDSGKQWSGRTCPQCQVTRSKINMKALRAKRKGSNV